jgi:hypothetical protein
MFDLNQEHGGAKRREELRENLFQNIHALTPENTLQPGY